ncbi:pilus assembly protein [Betaproteobacteria bacterium UKL13-2]|jgi:predicted nucleic acid-binding protein|nr:pilus assembly protein [Betaproteobacteria bacterium UKL13-2]HCG53144.1 VapC toxin family PIN domain ribonuclease [Betaproteobacteria bacterium]
MAVARPFFDTNVLLYLLSGDSRKADIAETLLGSGGTISVQVLNEFAAVVIRKLGMTTMDTREVLTAVRAACSVVPMTEETHERGLAIAERYALSIYDSMIVASALLSDCTLLISEDMQDQQVIEKKLTIRNPFRK